MSAGFNAAIQYGGNTGKGSYGCDSGFVGIGTLCFKFPLQSPAQFQEMADNCEAVQAIPYTPTGMVQNAVVKGLMETMVVLLLKIT